VERKPGGVDIILSRADEGFVKKLFELEVPEIMQGIVEIKAIARDPGERTKIAVQSKDAKIDSVGACVGMRGARVKEVVKELSGERIDIVRWSDDIREFAKNAVNPIEIYSMEIDRDAGEIRLSVPKDQLALLIGKRGRNIRVTSKLLGWEIKAESESELTDIVINDVPGLDDDIKKKLQDAGCSRASQVLEAGAEGLAKIEGIDKTMAENIVSLCEKELEEVNKEELSKGETAESGTSEETEASAKEDESKKKDEEKQ
jgi:N utilization substance protein A